MPIWAYLLLLTTVVLPENSPTLLRIPGDIMLGGLFPMHEHDRRFPDRPCGAVKEEKGAQRLEAMLYSLDLINEDMELLPNVTLGGVLMDTCSSDTYALEQSMEFVKSYMNKDLSEYRCESGSTPMYVPHKPITGVIGASFSTVSIMVANILRLFKIPQISYASTSAELSDKSRFEYFSRVVPPDNFQAQAMADIVKSFGWKYVSTLAIEGDYGEKGIASFVQLAEAEGICIAASEKILRNAKIEDYDRIVERLSQKAASRVVVVFADEDEVRLLLAATIRAQKAGQFIWVASDSWGAKSHPVRDQEWAAEGAITILPRRKSLTGFDEYFRSLRPWTSERQCSYGNVTWKNEIKKNRQTNCRNPWFREFWEQHFKCKFPAAIESKAPFPNVTKRGTTSVPFEDPELPACTGKEKLINYEQEGLVPFVVDAVYAMAHAIHAMINHRCNRELNRGRFHFCNKVKPAPSGKELLKYIRNVKFTGLQDQEVRFNKDGDAYGKYFIYQYQNLSSRFDYVKIGDWSGSLAMNVSMLKWEEGSGTTPRSICSEACPIGHIRNFQDQCCWSCVLCREDSYVFNDSCVTCEPGYGPTLDRSTCRKIPPEHLTWGSPWAIVPMAFSSLGVIATIFTTSVFIRFHETPVIMASGRELCYVLLAGILFCFLMSPVILAKPTNATCGFLRLGLGLCLSICYSAIFTKTNRISRIFSGGIKGVKRPSYTSPRSQIVICFGLVTLQLLGTTIWLFIERPATKEMHPYPLTAVLTCGISNLSLVMSLMYNMLLILMCTLYAFKTRKIPENFNEAKYIGFTMYSTCIIWLAFVPIYFGTNNDYKIQTATMSMCVSLSAFVVLGCIFCPKLYIVLFQPYKNVRQGGIGCRALAGNVRNNMKFGLPSRSTSGFQPSTASAQSVSSVGAKTPPEEVKTISQSLKHANGEQVALASPVVRRTSAR